MLVDNMQDPTMQGQYMAQPSPETAETMDPTQDMTDDDIAATLGYITTVSEKAMTPPDETVAEDEEASGEISQETEPQEDIGAVKDEIIGEIHSLREESISPEMQKEFMDTMAELKELLGDEKSDDNTNEKGEN